jgi:hypothetical protein
MLVKDELQRWKRLQMRSMRWDQGERSDVVGQMLVSTSHQWQKGSQVGVGPISCEGSLMVHLDCTEEVEVWGMDRYVGFDVG